jgi:hypothetical protein
MADFLHTEVPSGVLWCAVFDYCKSRQILRPMQPVKYWGESTFRDIFTTVIGESDNASDWIDNDIIKIYVHTSYNYNSKQPFPINGFDKNVELFVCVTCQRPVAYAFYL